MVSRINNNYITVFFSLLFSLFLAINISCGSNGKSDPENSPSGNNTGGGESSLEYDLSVETAASTNLGIKKVAAIIMYFTNNGAVPGTASQLRSALFTGSNSSNAFFQEVSYDKFSIQGADFADGDIFGPVIIPYPDSPCDWDNWANAAKTVAASEEGFDASKYDYVLYFHSSACGSVGRPELNPPGAIIDNFSQRAIRHEFGHGLGLSHASSLRCDVSSKSVTLSDSCKIVEYGDEFDAMGGPNSNVWPYSAQKRGQEGWLDDSDIVTVVDKQSVTLQSVSEKGAQTKVIRVPRISTESGKLIEFIYLDFKTPGGFEGLPASSAVMNGLSLRLAHGLDTVGRTYLLDVHPETATIDDAPLMKGETYTDPDTGMTVTLSSFNGVEAVVDIDPGSIKTCTQNDPTVKVQQGASLNPITPGSTVTYIVDMINADSKDCPDRQTFNVSWKQFPSGWTPAETGVPVEAVLNPGDVAKSALAMTIPASAVPGNYQVTVIVDNLLSGKSTEKTKTITVQ